MPSEPRESKELQQLRRDTNTKPAPMPEEAPLPVCPACGAELDRDTLSCVNPACETALEV